jgi:hypothetical protein
MSVKARPIAAPKKRVGENIPRRRPISVNLFVDLLPRWL